MPDTMEKAIRKAVVETFEGMAFMEVFSQQPNDKQKLPADPREVSLAVLEPFKGDFRLCLPKALLILIAETVYAIPAEELNDQVFQDTLFELLNTIAGQTLKEMLSEEQTFLLGLPRREEQARSAPEKIWYFQSQDQFFYLAYAGDEYRP